MLKPYPKLIKFSREKERWILGAIVYKLNRLANSVLGKKFTLQLTLNLSLIAWRIAYENSYVYFGSKFKDSTYGITPELLGNYLDKNCTVIDIGCGSGRLTKMASKIAKKALGIDYSPNSIAFANKFNSTNNTVYICGDLRTMDLQEQFDVAIMSGVLEHVDEPEKFLVRLHTIAKVLIIEVPDLEADPLNLARYNLSTRIYSDDDHVREYTHDALLSHLQVAGWEIIHLSSQGMQITVVAKPSKFRLGMV